ncbi:MAG: carboxymuconolactone decarboxylase family protein [Syntrophomonadaceae bacterium]|nr:carboxymuconolactone decarboxylase family protein [Syntrophomonadaceae bacterium]MDD3889351.1 carboxymuconolactone decarboxylase family protein [Syntrophomonadaceae bacterium]MDD4548319.1 carboxymuconolactone decarboxylase family protein [Syntrophomonadaceae bacterium]
MANPVELMEELGLGMPEIEEELPEITQAFVQMDNAAYIDGELDRKYKELIGLGIAVAVGCHYCMTIHVKQGLMYGANREEILEAAAVGVAFGGSPAYANLCSTVLKALEAYEE